MPFIATATAAELHASQNAALQQQDEENVMEVDRTPAESDVVAARSQPALGVNNPSRTLAPGPLEAVIPRGTCFMGSFLGPVECTVRIQGEYRGPLYHMGDVIIEEGARFVGVIHARRVRVVGEFIGFGAPESVVAVSLELTPSCSFDADVVMVAHGELDCRSGATLRAHGIQMIGREEILQHIEKSIQDTHEQMRLASRQPDDDDQEMGDIVEGEIDPDNASVSSRKGQFAPCFSGPVASAVDQEMPRDPEPTQEPSGTGGQGDERSDETPPGPAPIGWTGPPAPGLPQASTSHLDFLERLQSGQIPVSAAVPSHAGG